MEFSDICELAEKFRADRDWLQFHNPKDLAISINLEAAELLECFQWSGQDCVAEKNRELMADEVADVMLYCLYFASSIGVDPIEAMAHKLEVNRQKYPVDKAFGSSRKYTEL